MVAFEQLSLRGRKIVLEVSSERILASVLGEELKQVEIPIEWLSEVECDVERRQLCARCGFASLADIYKQTRFSKF